MDDIIIRLVSFPSKIQGVTRLDDDGDYNIYINSNLSRETQYKAYLHEIDHIREQHFDYNTRKNLVADEVEEKHRR